MKWQELKAEWNKDPKRRATMRAEFPFRHLADELVALRASLGLTQEQLASKMKTSQSVIARLEAGRHPVTTLTLTRVAVALEMSWRISFEPVDLTAVEALGGFEIRVPQASVVLPAPIRAAKRSARPANTNSYALAA